MNSEESEKMSTMPRDTSQRSAAILQTPCDRRTRSSRSTSTTSANNTFSPSPTKRARLHSSTSGVNNSTTMVVETSITADESPPTPTPPPQSQSPASASYLASSALTSLVFDMNAMKEETENGDDSGRSSEAMDNNNDNDGGGSNNLMIDDSISAIVNPFLTNHDEEDDEEDVDEECGESPPIGGDMAIGDGNNNAGEIVIGEGGTTTANGNNYYACAHCNKYFWTETSLKHHSSLYHSEKSFVCEICGKAFRFRSNLAEHRSVHTSLKPYVCKFCGKSSRLKGNLTKHILKHHKKEQNAYIGKDDIIIKKGKKSIKDPAAVDFLEKSMIVLTASTNNNANNGASSTTVSSAHSSTASKQTTSSASNNNNLSGQFGSLNTNDLGSAAMHLLSMASKTTTEPPSKSAPRQQSIGASSANKRNHQGLSTAASTLLINGGGNAKSTTSNNNKQRGENNIFGHGTSKTSFLPMLNNGKKSPNSKSESNRFPMLTAVSSSSPDSPINNYFHQHQSMENGAAKFDYEELFGRNTNLQPQQQQQQRQQPVRDVDALFESLLGRHLGTTTASMDLINFRQSPTTNQDESNNYNNGTVSPDASKSNIGGSGGGTRCQLCGKHFRKATNLAVHMSIKHNQPPTCLPVETNNLTVDSSSSPSPAVVNNIVRSMMMINPEHHLFGLSTGGSGSIQNNNVKFPTLINMSQQIKNSNLSSSKHVNVDQSKLIKSNQQHRHHQPSPSIPNRSAPILPSAVAPPSSNLMDSTMVNGLMTKSGVSKDLKEIRNVLQELKRGLPDVAKLDELLSALDARVDRLERQLETSVNTLYVLVQMQTDMNSAFCQFKHDVVQRLKSLKSQHGGQGQGGLVNGRGGMGGGEDEEEDDEEEESGTPMN